MNTIQDQFTNLPISRQRKYQLRKRALGLCTECGQPATPGGSKCSKHIVIYRERQRRLKGATRRYLNAASYRIQVS